MTIRAGTPAWGSRSARGSSKLTADGSGRKATDRDWAQDSSLPCRPSTRLRPCQSGPRPGPNRTAEARETILVLDDDPRMLRFVRRSLADAGYDPVVIADPDELLTSTAEHQPDLVLLDLMLPGAGGISLMRDLQAVTDVPVIFISVYGRDQTVAEAFEAGAADYIVKPFLRY